MLCTSLFFTNIITRKKNKSHGAIERIPIEFLSVIYTVQCKTLEIFLLYISYNNKQWLRAVDGKSFLESNSSSIPGTYFRLG